jgi:hypothetical protein
MKANTWVHNLSMRPHTTPQKSFSIASPRFSSDKPCFFSRHAGVLMLWEKIASGPCTLQTPE